MNDIKYIYQVLIFGDNQNQIEVERKKEKKSIDKNKFYRFSKKGNLLTENEKKENFINKTILKADDSGKFKNVAFTSLSTKEKVKVIEQVYDVVTQKGTNGAGYEIVNLFLQNDPLTEEASETMHLLEGKYPCKNQQIIDGRICWFCHEKVETKGPQQ